MSVYKLFKNLLSSPNLCSIHKYVSLKEYYLNYKIDNELLHIVTIDYINKHAKVSIAVKTPLITFEGISKYKWKFKDENTFHLTRFQGIIILFMINLQYIKFKIKAIFYNYKNRKQETLLKKQETLEQKQKGFEIIYSALNLNLSTSQLCKYFEIEMTAYNFMEM